MQIGGYENLSLKRRLNSNGNMKILFPPGERRAHMKTKENDVRGGTIRFRTRDSEEGNLSIKLV